MNPSMVSVRVSAVDMLRPLAALLLLDAALLAAWTAADPLQFDRTSEDDDYDTYGYPLRSQGTCTSPTAWFYLGPIVALHVCVLLCGLTGARTRHLPSARHGLPRPCRER